MCYKCAEVLSSQMRKHHHATIPTTGSKTLNIPGSCKALPQPHFGQLDYISLFLLPT